MALVKKNAPAAAPEKAASANSVAAVMKALVKEYGEIGGEGFAYPDYRRIPTGIFAFDLATGGGFPEGKISVVYGPESSGKTILIYKAIGNYQKMEPGKVCVLVDLEGAHDPLWARALGVDTDRLYVIAPNDAEQACDAIDAMLRADDIGIVAVDSLAAMATHNEVMSAASKASVGGASLIISKLYRKVTQAINHARLNGGNPTLLLINQIRNKVGVMFGNPETQPGGFAFKFASSLTVRVYGKNVVDSKIHPELPAYKEINAVLQKWKVPVVALSSVYNIAVIPGCPVPVGACEDFNTVKGYLEDYGWLQKGDKKGWVLFDEAFDTLQPIRDKLFSKDGISIRAKIIERVRATTQLIEPQD